MVKKRVHIEELCKICLANIIQDMLVEVNTSVPFTALNEHLEKVHCMSFHGAIFSGETIVTLIKGDEVPGLKVKIEDA